MKVAIINSIKVSIAVALAIAIASFLKVDFAISAGIVAILTIAPTKKETVKIAVNRLFAFAFALVIAIFVFWILGINELAFVVFVLLYALVCYYNKWTAALAMNSVLISHFLTLGYISLAAIFNECLIFIIGVGVGVVVNMHLHKNSDAMKVLRDQTDEQIVHILSRMSERILNVNLENYNGDCFYKLEKILRNAKNMAEENYNNQFGNKRDYDKDYIAMRERQYNELLDMYENAKNIKTTPQTAAYLAEFLNDMAKVFHEDNDGKLLMEKFRAMNDFMKEQPLPEGRQEFEDRARLFVLMRNIETFIEIKQLFIRMEADDK